jgi:putative spermidine/putrescine transport system ATP-binding protein
MQMRGTAALNGAGDEVVRGQAVTTTQPEATRLKVAGLRKTYGDFVALHGADLEVRQGEFLTLLGPSGSGKTTLLMMIAGLLYPDGGDIWIDGRLATFEPPNRRDIGMVFQNYALFPHMTVYDNIAFPLRMRRRPESEVQREVMRALEIVRLPDLARRRPAQLSGGQQQRIALARCIVYKPPIILMDEPLGALDKRLRDELQLEIRELHRETGITIVYVTHDQEEALVMSDRICVMQSGRIDQIGAPEQVYFEPATRFVAGFLGESNIFNARVTEADAGRLVVATPFSPHIVLRPRAGAGGVGEMVTVMLRPESARILAPDQEAENRVEATVTDVIMTGQLTRFYLRLRDGTEMTVTELTNGPRPRHRAGTAVQLGFDRSGATVIPEPPASQ